MSTLGESNNQGPGRPLWRHAPKVIGVLLVLVFAAWAGGRVGDKMDAITQSVVDLKSEHDRLCRMYALFGPLEGDEEINPKMFPHCRRVYTPTVYIGGVPFSKSKEETQ